MTVPLTIADGTPSVSQCASDSSPTASRTPSNPTARHACPVGVARHEMGDALLDEPERRRPRAPAAAAVERCGRQLDESSLARDQTDPLEVGLRLGVAFRVGEHGRDPVRQEPAEDPLEPERPAEIGHLDEHVGRVAAEAEAPKLVGREPVHPLQRELAARQDLDRDPLVRDRGPDGGERLLHLGDRGRIVLPYVRRAGDRPHAAGGGRPSELDAVGERLRPVVEARKNVGMQVDHGASRLASAPVVAGSATGYCEPPPATIPLAARTYVRFNGERAARLRLARSSRRAPRGAGRPRRRRRCRGPRARVAACAGRARPLAARAARRRGRPLRLARQLDRARRRRAAAARAGGLRRLRPRDDRPGGRLVPHLRDRRRPHRASRGRLDVRDPRRTRRAAPRPGRTADRAERRGAPPCAARGLSSEALPRVRRRRVARRAQRSLRRRLRQPRARPAHRQAPRRARARHRPARAQPVARPHRAGEPGLARVLLRHVGRALPSRAPGRPGDRGDPARADRARAGAWRPHGRRPRGAGGSAPAPRPRQAAPRARRPDPARRLPLPRPPRPGALRRQGPRSPRPPALVLRQRPPAALGRGGARRRREGRVATRRVGARRRARGDPPDPRPSPAGQLAHPPAGGLRVPASTRESASS